jgi:hypothetical protein
MSCLISRLGASPGYRSRTGASAQTANKSISSSEVAGFVRIQTNMPCSSEFLQSSYRLCCATNSPLVEEESQSGTPKAESGRDVMSNFKASDP